MIFPNDSSYPHRPQIKEDGAFDRHWQRLGRAFAGSCWTAACMVGVEDGAFDRYWQRLGRAFAGSCWTAVCMVGVKDGAFDRHWQRLGRAGSWATCMVGVEDVAFDRHWRRLGQPSLGRFGRLRVWLASTTAILVRRGKLSTRGE